MKVDDEHAEVKLSILHGDLALSRFVLKDFGEEQFQKALKLRAGEESQLRCHRE